MSLDSIGDAIANWSVPVPVAICDDCLLGIANSVSAADFASVMMQLGVDVFGGEGWEAYDSGEKTPDKPEGY